MTRRVFAVAMAALVGSVGAGVGWAHEGHAHKTMGTVTMVHENHVEVRDVKGVVTTHQLDARTKIKRGRTVVRAADIRVGDRVVITTVEPKNPAGTVVKTVTQVDVGITPATTSKK